MAIEINQEYKTIKIFKCINDGISLPLFKLPNRCREGISIGSYLVSFDNKTVYAKTWKNNNENEYVKLLNDVKFFEANDHLFELIS